MRRDMILSSKRVPPQTSELILDLKFVICNFTALRWPRFVAETAE
jgi:hypothetical protein